MSADNSFVELPATAPPVGIIAGMEFPVSHLSLDGGSLYIFTDGVTESMDVKGNELGVEGLTGLISKHCHEAAGIRLEQIVETIRQPGISQHDDITILLIECSN